MPSPKPCTQAAILLLILVTSCHSDPQHNNPHDRTFLRGLIAIRKQFIPHTSAVERRLNNELNSQAPNSPFSVRQVQSDASRFTSVHPVRSAKRRRPEVRIAPDWQRSVNARRIRDRGANNQISYWNSNRREGLPVTKLPIRGKLFSENRESASFQSPTIVKPQNASIRLTSSYSNVAAPDAGEKNSLNVPPEVLHALRNHPSIVSATKKILHKHHVHRDRDGFVVVSPNTNQQNFFSNTQNSDFVQKSPFSSNINRNDYQNQVTVLQNGHAHSEGINVNREFSAQNPDITKVELPSQEYTSTTLASVKNSDDSEDDDVPERGVGAELFQIFMSGLRSLPVLGNVLKANVDPMYRPLINSILPATAEDRQSTSEEFQEEVHCVDTLGCFVTTIDFYDPIFRPINLPPDTRKSINVHYTLYTRKQRKGVPIKTSNVNKLKITSYNPKLETKFIIHGFLDDQNSTWIKDMVRGFLYHSDCNVFVVDWSGGSQVIYPQAVTNIRVVALEVATFIKWTAAELGQRPEMVHVVGHSLGSHTSGYIGEQVPGLGRITGLDPAEPFFQHMPPSVRLDPSDATFVDVIHTDSDSIITLGWQFSGYGLEQPIGHVDFYPNGGKQQPGCNSLSRIPLTVLQDGTGIAEGFDAAEKEAVACNHVRANKLFTASLFGSCSFMSFPCQSFRQFEKAECFSCDSELGCAQLGINANQWNPNGQKHVKMYLSTSEGPNFCQYHYKLTLTIADDRELGGVIRGRLTITLITDSGELKEFDLAKNRGPVTLRRGKSRSFLLRHTEDLSTVTEALLRWEYEPDVFNPMTFCVIFCSTDLEVAALTLTPLDTEGMKPVIHEPTNLNVMVENLNSTTISERSSSADDYDHLTDNARSSVRKNNDIVMCHKQGHSFVRIISEKTIKISAQPFCADIKKTEENRRRRIVEIDRNL